MNMHALIFMLIFFNLANATSENAIQAVRYRAQAVINNIYYGTYNDIIDDNVFTQIQAAHAELCKEISLSEARYFAEETLNILNDYEDNLYESLDLKKSILEWLTKKQP